MRHIALNIRKTSKEQAGFTIVEFLIATGVFSVVVLLCSYAIVHVGRMYYRGVITNRTQDTARRVVEDIAAAVQYGSSSGSFVRPGVSDDHAFISWCVGNNRYTYTTTDSLGTGDGQVPHVLWKDTYTSGDCPALDLADSPDPGGINGQEMLGENMRITRFTIEDISEDTYEIDISIAYGDDVGLFEPASNNDTPDDATDDTEAFSICKGVNAGGQFCAVSPFKTQVKRRL